MKKIAFILPSLLILALAPSAFAINTNVGGQNANLNLQAQQQLASPSPSGNQTQNQNQVKTQNQGEDSQLQVSTQEQQQLEQGQGEGLQTRNQAAIANMSEVAKKVQELLQLRTTGGIGDQVRLIAKEQNQAQTQIQKHLNKLDSKGKFAKLMTGTDTTAVNNLKTQLVQNRLRIEQLEKLQNQLTNKSDINMIEETIQALIQENTSLQERITSEEQTKSLFGWLFRFFAK